jgi:Polyketide cyclase / dehydrase and lipid transport
MRRRRIEVSATSVAPPSAVYALLIEGTTWTDWSPIESFELERPGEGAPEGVGAIRVFRRGRTTGRDQVLELVPDRRLRYASLSGLPVRDYVGEVELEPVPGGTHIRWQSSFFPAVRGTGWFVERGIRRFLAGCVRGLAEYAASHRDASAT